MMDRLILASALMLAAAPAVAGPDPELGAVVRNNVAAQVINRDPNYDELPQPLMSGRRASDAMIRYETGKLKPLLKTNGKTDVGGQGGADDTPSVTIPLISTGSPN